jgi:sterol desaturase/sphingolipid hydroxylase (fatty acid hydroxylase superfamily)
MGDWLLAHEGPVRLGVFLGLFALLAALQAWRPLRGVPAPWRRFGRHLWLALMGSALVRLAFPMVAVAVGAAVDARDTGLLQWLALPAWAQILTGVVLLDLAIYWQHRVFHRVPLLWRLHRMHHSDTAFEVSTAIRFHPLEIALSMLIKIGVVAALGVPAVGVLLFEILLNATALFSHADLRLPRALDRAVRSVLVTPDMHRIHHSVVVAETNSNYGFCLSLWDRLFASYLAHPASDDRLMPIGIERFRNAREQSWWQLLGQPFR